MVVKTGIFNVTNLACAMQVRRDIAVEQKSLQWRGIAVEQKSLQWS